MKTEFHAQQANFEPFWFSSFTQYGSVLHIGILFVLHLVPVRPRAIHVEYVVDHRADRVMEKSGEGMAEFAGDEVAEKLEQHGDAFAGFMSGVQSSVFNSISAQTVGPQGFVENVQG